MLHQVQLTPTQQAAIEHGRRFRAGIEARASKPVTIPILPDPEIVALRGDLKTAKIEIEELRKRVLDHCGDLAEMKTIFKKHFAGQEQIKKIQCVVALYYGVSRGHLLSAYRGAEYIRPRHVAMYLAQTMTGHSLPVIGRHFGGKDHTTIMHAARKIAAERLVNSGLDEEIKSIVTQLGGVEA